MLVELNGERTEMPDGATIASAVAATGAEPGGAGLAVALDGEVAHDGRPLGRAVACSTFHHFADMNWDGHAGAPSFVTDAPGHEMERDPERFAIYKGYVHNIADWLVADRAAGSQTGAAA